MSYATQSTPTGESTDAETDVDTDSAVSEASTDDRRDVIVPLRIYKAVSVFSTLFAILAIVAGFIVLDAATNRATVDLSQVDPLVALVGLGVIVFGAAVYAYSTRFRTADMSPDGGERNG